MTMSEIEARKKCCPLLVAQRFEENDNCGASKCMAWRWAQKSKYCGSDGIFFENESRAGFCGLAGVVTHI